MRVRPRPRHRASAAVRFADFETGASAVRALSQSGLNPANCRLIDPAEAALTGAGDGSAALLVLGFESADHDVEPWMSARAASAAVTTAGSWERRPRDGDGGRDAVGELARGVPARAVPARHAGRDRRAVGDVRDRDHVGPVRRISRRGAANALRPRSSDACGDGLGDLPVHARVPGRARAVLHVLAPARPRRRARAVGRRSSAPPSDAVIACGGTITHHHAVGRDHRPWYDRQRPDAFAQALRAAKRAVDPTGALNPGVLIDPVAITWPLYDRIGTTYTARAGPIRGSSARSTRRSETRPR